eukprot:CAMPEP_0185041086 /NCGR_PEP_ID=MMETSP1103-20130426/39925_1 /TAXON_ID=36769 /ORGANISM="Paraphysomonas bandaiensis, Strain Caron Lab Isolate" /LENGTH=204 /DNA_ID=CAMNT_0027580667 /DNA_START=76 /DNA_END=690 /DNA_ORIENTATION=-
MEEYLLGSSYGCGGVIIAVMMYTRQKLGSKPVVPQYPLLTFHLLPTCTVAFFTLLWILGVHFLTVDISFIWISYLFSWTYLRFFYKYEADSTGDSSEGFTFMAMFPEVLHPVVLPLTIAFYNLFSITGVFPKIEVDKKLQHHLRYQDTKADAVHYSTPPPSGGGGDAVAERRRAKAIKLLDAKMAELSKEPEGWEDIKDPNEDV